MHFNLICISELWSPRLLKILTPEGLNWLLGNVDLKRKLFTQGELSITPQYIIVAHLVRTDSNQVCAGRTRAREFDIPKDANKCNLIFNPVSHLRPKITKNSRAFLPSARPFLIESTDFLLKLLHYMDWEVTNKSLWRQDLEARHERRGT